MKKASKAILGGLIGVVGAGAGAVQAGIGGPLPYPAVGVPGNGPDSDFDLNVVCKPDGSAEFEGADGCFYEVSWRCDGPPAEAGETDNYGLTYGFTTYYGVCISGSFAGGVDVGMAASWAADVLLQEEARGACEGTDYGFYGWLTEGPFGPPAGVSFFDWTELTKLEGKFTSADRGNGKESPHPGRKEDTSNFLTVEVELKRTGECVD